MRPALHRQRKNMETGVFLVHYTQASMLLFCQQKWSCSWPHYKLFQGGARMITLKLTHYSYAQMVILEKALHEAYISVKCTQPHCSQCQNERVCADLVSALAYVKTKIAALETSEPDPPSDCFWPTKIFQIFHPAIPKNCWQMHFQHGIIRRSR